MMCVNESRTWKKKHRGLHEDGGDGETHYMPHVELILPNLNMGGPGLPRASRASPRELETLADESKLLSRDQRRTLPAQSSGDGQTRLF